MELRLTEKLLGLHWPLVALIATIGLIGYIVLYSAGGGSHEPWAARHGVRLAFGLLLMLAISLSDVRILFRYAYAIYAVCLVLLIAVEVVGSLNKGAQRWIDLGVFQLQPSELMKIALALALARYFHPAFLEEVRRPLYLLPPILFAAIPAALVLRQPDLGTAVMLMAVGVGVLFFGGCAALEICAGGTIHTWHTTHFVEPVA